MLKNILLALTSLLVLISAYAGTIIYKHVKDTRNRSLSVLVVSWFSWSFSYFLTIIAEVTIFFIPNYMYWKYILITGIFFQIIGVLYLVLFVSRNAKNTVGVFKIITLTAIGTLYVSLSIVTNELIPNENTIYQVTGFLMIVQMTFGLFFFYLYFEWIYRVWRNSPKSLKKNTTLLFFMFLIFSVIAIFGYVTSFLFVYNILILYVFHGGIILSITVAIRLDPRIINILPFVVYRLQVINRKSGVLLYEYSWSEEKRQELSSFIHGIQKLSQDTFQRGELIELHLREGLLMLDYSEKLTYALFTTKSTTYLHYCFQNFTNYFEDFVKRKNIHLEGVVDTKNFEFGNELIAKYFNYIPSRVQN